MNVEYVIHGFGFGFDETNDDYKIIRVMTHYSHEHHEMMREISVHGKKSDFLEID